MARRPDWQDVGDAKTLAKSSLLQVTAGETPIALSRRNGTFHAISGVCNHLGGPLSETAFDGDYVTCPWHFTSFHRETGVGGPGHEEDRVPMYAVRVESGRVLVDLASATARHQSARAPERIDPAVVRSKGPIRVVGISTTTPTPIRPPRGTSDALLGVALEHAATLGAVVHSIRLRDSRRRFGTSRQDESRARDQWPCSIHQMDERDRKERIYEALVQEADVIVVAAPIHRGAPSNLYFRMVDRLNSAQARQVSAGRMLMQRKVAGFIVTGGRENVQSVAGEMLECFAELGCQFPAFPFVSHGRGPGAEDLARRVRHARGSEALQDGARGLAARAIGFAKTLLAAPVR